MLGFPLKTEFKKYLFSALVGFRSEPQQDAAHHRHPAQEPDQTNRLLEQLPEGSHRRRAVQRREDLPNQTDPGSEETGLLEERRPLSTLSALYPNFLSIGRRTVEKKHINNNGYLKKTTKKQIFKTLFVFFLFVGSFKSCADVVLNH